MATAEELLAQMEENSELYADSTGPVNDVIMIDAETRTIELPESEKIFGVESDKASERKYFRCQKIVGDNIDLSTLNLFINFKNANNEGDIYPIDDVEVEGDYITFSWLLSKKVTAYKTDANKNQLLSFIFCAKSGEGLDNEWNTTICSDGIVLEGLEPGETIAEDNPDIIQYILERLDSAGTITPEQISGAVEEYFVNNPIEETDPTVPAWAKEETPDKSLTQEGKAADAKEVGDRLGQLSYENAQLKSDIDDLKNNGVSGGSGEGLSEDVKALILVLAKNGMYENDTQVAIDQLENLFNGGSIGTYTVTYDLTNATSDNTSETTKAGLPFVANLTPNEDYALDVVAVIMNGVDVSSKVYSKGVINIPSVNGNVEITVTTKSAIDETLVYQLNEPMTFDGTSSYATGYTLGTNLQVNAYSVLVDFDDGEAMEESGKIWGIETLKFALTVQNGRYSFRLIGNQQYVGSVYVINSPTKVVLTHNAGDINKFSVYCIIDGEVQSYLDCVTNYNINNVTDTEIKLGGTIAGATNNFVGTINEFKVYNRVLTTDEIYSWLKVE